MKKEAAFFLEQSVSAWKYSQYQQPEDYHFDIFRPVSLKPPVNITVYPYLQIH